jgi:hypothetical protein
MLRPCCARSAVPVSSDLLCSMANGY